MRPTADILVEYAHANPPVLSYPLSGICERILYGMKTDDEVLAAAEACANKWRARGDEPVIGEAVHAEHTLEAVAIARRLQAENAELRETLERVRKAVDDGFGDDRSLDDRSLVEEAFTRRFPRGRPLAKSTSEAT